MRRAFLILAAVAGLVFAQGTPHYMLGFVENFWGGHPSEECLTFKAFIAGGRDTIRYPGDPRATYNEANGGWSVQIAELAPRNGDIFVIIFKDTCTGLEGTDTATVILDSVTQDMGVTILSSPSGVEDKSQVVPAFRMNLTPSPFNDVCEIKIDGEGEITVEIYNCLGNKVADLYSGEVKGNVVLRWKPRDLPGGVYFVRVKNRDTVYTAKVMYLP